MEEVVEYGAYVASSSDFTDVRAADLAELLNGLDAQDAANLLMRLPGPKAIAALDRPEFVDAAMALNALPIVAAAALVAHMSADRAADVLAELGHVKRENILASLDMDARASLRSLIAYPADSAGGMMTTEFVSIPRNATVSAALDHIRSIEQSRETIYSIYIIDPGNDALVGRVSLRRLIVPPLVSNPRLEPGRASAFDSAYNRYPRESETALGA